MIFREATINDIKQIQIVRHSVKENRLSNPDLVTDEDCKEYITARGKGWVCETGNKIVGFAIADLKKNNIWGLFVKPENEKTGIGKKLHDTMLDWYFSKTNKTVWLGTAPNTRAETFYKKCGWKHLGALNTFEEKFEMSYNNWKTLN
ncbi:MAG: GNAT family N-acetyltransferase, partial [Bacteroidia bacterium]